MATSPSDLHQGLIDLVRGDPTFAIELAYRASSLLPLVGVAVHDLGTDLRVISPFGGDRHLRPDFALGLFRDGKLLELWLGEVQLSHNGRKLDVMSACRAAAQLHHRVPAFGLMLSPKPEIRAWTTRKSWPTVFDPPAIVAPSHFPALAREDARSRPHACLLRAFFHADDFDALRLGVEAARMLSLPNRQRFTAMLLEFTDPSMNEQLQALLRELEAEDDPEPDAWDRSRAGWHRAFNEGRTEGRSEGEIEGRLQAKREALIDILEVRGVSLEAASRETIDACQDLERLESWIARAKRATQLDDVFVGG